jgi:hypothetical protein
MKHGMMFKRAEKRAIKIIVREYNASNLWKARRKPNPNRRPLCHHSRKNLRVIVTFPWGKNPERKRKREVPAQLYTKRENKRRNNTPQRKKGQPA